MRSAAILGLGSSTKHLHSFARNSDASWRLGLPAGVGEADAILIFGGDGTIHRHLAQLARLQLPVLVVPCGSGNDFARSLNRPFLRNSEGATSVKKSEAAAQDSLSRYFSCVGGVGLDAEIARRANQLPRWIRRRGGYVFSLLPALLGFEAPRVKIQSDLPDSSSLAVQHDGPGMVVAFANAPTYGDGIRIAPHAKLDDGKLDICVVGAMNKLRLLRLFPSVYSGSHLSVPEVKYFQTERLRVETDKPIDVYADGEYVCRTPVEVSVERAALRVIVSGEQSEEKGGAAL